MGEIDGTFRAWGVPRGGMGAVSDAIAAAARAAGATLITDAPVARVLLHEGRATGVVLANGDEHRAAIVVSSADLRVTFERLVGLNQVPADFADSVRHFRFRGASAKVNLALDALPEFLVHPEGDAHLRGAISISPSMDYMEHAYDEAKYGWYSSRPYLDIIIPSLNDPTLAPPGKHVMSCFVQYAPYHLRASSWDAERENLGDAVVNAIATFAPNIRGRILHRQVVTPLDLERDLRADGRQHLPRRADARSALLVPSGARLGEISHADRQPLSLRLLRPPRRRRHGRPRPQRRPRNPPRHAPLVEVSGAPPLSPGSDRD